MVSVAQTLLQHKVCGISSPVWQVPLQRRSGVFHGSGDCFWGSVAVIESWELMR